MKHLRFATTLGAVALWLMASGAARADSVLYNAAGFIEGQESFVQGFDITTPGTLTVSLTQIPWLDTITNLGGFISTPSKVLGQTFSDGGETLTVGPGMVYTHWFGDANGEYGAGVYGIKIIFRPAGQAAVPLPASVVLLMSGLILLAAVSRRVAAVAAAQAALAAAGPPSSVGDVGKQ